MRSSGSMWQVLSHVSCCLLMFGLVERFIALSKRLFGLTRSALLTLHNSSATRLVVVGGGVHQCNHIIAIAIHGSISNVSCFGIYMSLYFRTDPILFPLAGAQHPEWREEKKFSKKIGKVFRYRRTKLNRIKSKFTINSVCSTAKSYRFGASIFFLTIAKNNIWYKLLCRTQKQDEKSRNTSRELWYDKIYKQQNFKYISWK